MIEANYCSQDNLETEPCLYRETTVPTSGNVRVVRGGEWNDYAKHLRNAYRSSKNPNTFANNVGFRVARNANLDSGKFVIINEIETVDKHDISGDKTLIVYFSWRGGRLGQNVNDISKLASDSVIGEALSVYCSDDNGWVIFNKFYYFWLGLNSSIILNSSIKMFSC